MKEESNNQMGSTFYNLLPEARNPLRIAVKNQLMSIFDFKFQQPFSNNQSVELQLLDTPNLQPNKAITHQIGQKFADLFKKPSYIMHKNLNCTDNDKFGTCNIQVSSQNKVAIHQENTKHDGLIFQSRFESGNLAMASLGLQQKSYNLIIHKDFNSKECSTQWFYFLVKNNHHVGNYTFHIINYMKSHSAFQKLGMKICIYSSKTKQWVRGGKNIQYRKNSIIRDQMKSYYTLSFTYQFLQQNQEVYFAYCYPYTQTRLHKFLSEMQQKYPLYFHRKQIVKTIGGNNLQMLTITNHQMANKKAIIISARVHPGQTVGSFICQGMIRFLLGPNKLAERLRNQYIFRIFPMLNPDGVVNGNYRTSLSGDDLNRQWKFPDKIKHAQIYTVKKLIQQIPVEKKIYLDLHGHSKKKSVFMYGCQDIRNPYLARQFPYYLSRKIPQFTYYSCNFTTPKHRQGTARMSIWKQMNVAYSYTIQSSFCSVSKSKQHLRIEDYIKIGALLGQQISQFFCRKKQTQKEVQAIIEQFYNNEDLIEVGQQDTQASTSQQQQQNAQEQLKPNIIDEIQKPFSIDRKFNNFIPPTMKKRWFYYEKRQMRKTTKIQLQEPILKHRQVGQKLKIHYLQLNPSQDKQSSARANQINLRKFCEHAEIESSFNPTITFKPNSNKHLSRTPDINSMLFPKILRNQYKKYQRYRKLQHNISVTTPIYGKQKRNLSTNRSIDKSMERYTSDFLYYGTKEISLTDKINSKISNELKKSQNSFTSPIRNISLEYKRRNPYKKL